MNYEQERFQNSKNLPLNMMLFHLFSTLEPRGVVYDINII